MNLPNGTPDPAPRAVAVTDDGLVVARGADFQQLWRPLVDGEVVDLADTAPGQVVIGNTGAGLLVTAGTYVGADGTRGDPYLARLSDDGTLTRVAAVPTHDVLEASGLWLAYVPPGTVGGEASATDELRVQRIDGSDSGCALTARRLAVHGARVHLGDRGPSACARGHPGRRRRGHGAVPAGAIVLRLRRPPLNASVNPLSFCPPSPDPSPR